MCVCSLAAAAGLLSGGTLRDVERNGERRGDHVQRGGVRSPRYAAAALCVLCDVGGWSSSPPPSRPRCLSGMSLSPPIISEDCTDCFGAPKKDEPNDKEKKEEEGTSTSAHLSIIETWDWGRQPGETAATILLLLLLLLYYCFIIRVC